MTQQAMQELKYRIADEMIASQGRVVLRMYRQRRDEVLRVLQVNYAKYLVDVPRADYTSTLNAYNRLAKMDKEFKGIFVKLNNGSRSTITALQRDLFEESYYRSQYTMTMFADRRGDSIRFQALNPNVTDLSVTGDLSHLQKLRGKALERAKELIPPSGDTLSGMLLNNNTQALNRLSRTVKQGLANGESYAKQVKRVKDVFDGNASNAMRVIRTEGNRNVNAGAYYNSQVLSEQIPIQRMWVATLDDRTRDRHGALDGQIVGVDEPFRINGFEAMYPGDFGDPALDINCRCTVIDIVDGVSPTARRGRDPVTGDSRIAGYETYDEWLKRKSGV